MKKFFIGVDVSKKSLDVAVVSRSSADGSITRHTHWTFENSTAGFRRMVCSAKGLGKGLDAGEFLFCAETTGGCEYRMCDYLYTHGYYIWREDARQLGDSTGTKRGKDDEADSWMIAEYAARHFDQAVPYEPESPAMKGLKALLLYRRSLVEAKKAAATRAAAVKDTGAGGDAASFIRRDAQKGVRSLEKRIRECEAKIRELVGREADVEKNYRHLTSIRGVAMVNAVAMIAFTQNFRSFKTANKLASYYGVAPFRKISGTSVNRRSDVRRLSNLMLKAYISEAANVAVVHDGRMRAYYKRMIDKGKPRGVAMNNVKNKILHIAFALVRNDCDYEQHHENIYEAEKATNETIRTSHCLTQ